MIETPQNARSQRTRDAVLEAALELLRKHGAAAVTMANVAERAGCTRRGLYLHFPSRAELLVALVGYTDERFELESHRRGLEEATDAEGMLRALGTFLGGYHTKIAPLIRAIEAEREVDAAARASWKVAMTAWRAGAARVIEKVCAEHRLPERFREPAEAVDLLYALMSVDLVRVLVDERRWKPERYGEAMGDLFVATFLSDPATPRRPKPKR